MKSVILIPSDVERRLFSAQTKTRLSDDVVVRVCGVGMVASAAATAAIVSQHQPERIFLVGIAGSFQETAAVGQAMIAKDVLQFGIGVGEADRYLSAERAEFHRFNQDAHLQTPDRITLTSQPPTARDRKSATVLSVATASSCPDEAKQRKRLFPDADLEDMESYSVAHACRISNVPVAVVRGVSNVAGDRDVANWDVEGAMQAAGNLLLELLK